MGLGDYLLWDPRGRMLLPGRWVVGEEVSQFVYTLVYYAPVVASTRADRGVASPIGLCGRKEGLFLRGGCTTTAPPLGTFVERRPGTSLHRRTRCVLMYSTCRLGSGGDVALLHGCLRRCPSAPCTGHVCTLLTTNCFCRRGCSRTLTLFGSTRLSLLNGRRQSSVACLLTAYCLGAKGMGRTTV